MKDLSTLLGARGGSCVRQSGGLTGRVWVWGGWYVSVSSRGPVPLGGTWISFGVTTRDAQIVRGCLRHGGGPRK